MAEVETPSLPLLACEACRATGVSRWKRCAVCRGMAMGLATRGQWLYWDYPLEPYHLALEKARGIFFHLRFIAIFLLGINFWLWMGLLWYRAAAPLGNIFSVSDLSAFARGLSGSVQLLFWLGTLSFTYLSYRAIREKERPGLVEKYRYGERDAPAVTTVQPRGWSEVLRIPRRQRRNIAGSFTREARQTLGSAFQAAAKAGNPFVGPRELFAALLATNRVGNIFTRLGIPVGLVAREANKLSSFSGPKTSAGTSSQLMPETMQIIFSAYEEAYRAHQQYVSVTELFMAAVNAAPELRETLFAAGVEENKLKNVIEWARIRERLYRNYQKFRLASVHRSISGIDRAMTAVATPYLNQFSDDLTLLAQFGQTHPCVAREQELEEIFRVIEAGQENVLLVGDFGVGKKSIVEGIAGRMVADDVPDRLQDKRLVRLSISALLSGATPSGALERLAHCLFEANRAGNIVLAIYNAYELFGAAAGGSGQSLDLAGALADQLGGGRGLVIATATSEAYARQLANSKLGAVFAKVEIKELDENQAIQALESRAGQIEHKQQIFFSYDAVEKSVQFAKRYLHEICLPGSALEIMREAAGFARSKRGLNSLVTGEDAAAVVAAKTKIPLTAVTADETARLLHLEQALHERLVGQDEAVSLVANALRRARAELRSGGRPIANFLFLGPTGVGKTELAKTIAAVYFGAEESMARFDMSEYQDPASIYRLIGRPGEKGSGILTEKIRRNPFSLLLLDEIEKADKDILNLFLQVMDDGRLTDSTGRTVDFTSVILIATSNAGTSYVQEQMRLGIASDIINSRLLHGQLKEYFRPEFLNRFDGIVLFRPLAPGDIRRVASLMLGKMTKDLEHKGITFEVEESGLDFIATAGFDPEFGARPLRRAIQDKVENQIATLLLAGKLQRRDTVSIGAGGEITVKSPRG